LLLAGSLLLGLFASHNFAQTAPERFWLAGRVLHSAGAGE
jgi:hypothetical protein